MTRVEGQLKKTGLMVQLPMGDGGGPAIEAEPEAWAAIQHAAISAVAREHVLGPEIRAIERIKAKGYSSLVFRRQKRGN